MSNKNIYFTSDKELLELFSEVNNIVINDHLDQLGPIMKCGQDVSGENNPMYGRKQSEESNEKNRQWQKKHRIGARPDVIAKCIAARTGKKRGKYKTSGILKCPKPKIVCRIRDKKEMDIANFFRYP